MVAGEPGWCARVWKRLKGKERERPPRRKTDWCPLCGVTKEHRLIVNMGLEWKAWACETCNVVTQEAG